MISKKILSCALFTASLATHLSARYEEFPEELKNVCDAGKASCECRLIERLLKFMTNCAYTTAEHDQAFENIRTGNAADDDFAKVAEGFEGRRAYKIFLGANNSIEEAIICCISEIAQKGNLSLEDTEKAIAETLKVFYQKIRESQPQNESSLAQDHEQEQMSS